MPAVADVAVERRAGAAGDGDDQPAARCQVLRGVAQQDVGLVDMLEDLRADRYRRSAPLIVCQLGRGHQVALGESGCQAGAAAATVARCTPSALYSMPRTSAWG